jgi:hypothetical protein
MKNCLQANSFKLSLQITFSSESIYLNGTTNNKYSKLVHNKCQLEQQFKELGALTRITSGDQTKQTIPK